MSSSEVRCFRQGSCKRRSFAVLHSVIYAALKGNDPFSLRLRNMVSSGPIRCIRVAVAPSTKVRCLCRCTYSSNETVDNQGPIETEAFHDGVVEPEENISRTK